MGVMKASLWGSCLLLHYPTEQNEKLACVKKKAEIQYTAGGPVFTQSAKN